MNVDWIFTLISGASAVLLLLFPRVILIFMYKITFGIMRLQRLEIPEYYKKNYELLMHEPIEFFTKYKGQHFMLTLTGVVALLLFFASVCIPTIFP